MRDPIPDDDDIRISPLSRRTRCSFRDACSLVPSFEQLQALLRVFERLVVFVQRPVNPAHLMQHCRHPVRFAPRLRLCQGALDKRERLVGTSFIQREQGQRGARSYHGFYIARLLGGSQSLCEAFPGSGGVTRFTAAAFRRSEQTYPEPRRDTRPQRRA